MVEKRSILEARQDFPALKATMNGKPLAFLDSGSSAQKPQAVIDAMDEVLCGGYANIHRGLYAISQELTTAFEAVRAKVAAFIGAQHKGEIIFTRNTTEAINLVAQSWGRTFLRAGDEIILTEMEHHANLVPWQILRDQIGIVIKFIPFDKRGVLDLETFEKALSPKTKLVGLVHISNTLGTVNPINKIIGLVKNFNPEIQVLIDGSQSIVHTDINILSTGADFFCFTGHKLYGPTGIGVLYGRYDLLQTMPPYQGGGDMIETVSCDQVTYKNAPARFEAGTPAIVEAIGLGAAIDYMTSWGMDTIAAHEADMLAYAQDQLQTIDGLQFYGTAPHKAGIISFTLGGAHISDVGMILDQCGVAVRTGHHCCMPLMQRLKIDGTVRASLGLYTHKADIDALVAGLHKARELLL